MNLSPTWCLTFAENGIEARHWSEVGDRRAPDSEILLYARAHGYIVFTNDLDFGTILANTRGRGPSVIQVRAQALLPEDLREVVLAALRQFVRELAEGALIVVDPVKTRVRLLPLNL